MTRDPAVEYLRAILSSTLWEPTGNEDAWIQVLGDSLIAAMAFMGRNGHMAVPGDEDEIRRRIYGDE